MKTSATTIAFILLLFLTAACKKDETKTETTSKTTLLTGRDWVITSYLQVTGSVSYDVYANYAACKKDDLYKFNTDHTLTIKSGAIKCTPSETDVIAGAWMFEPGEAKIDVLFAGVSDTTVYVIDELSTSSFKVTNTVVDNGTTQQNKISYSAK